VNDIEESRRFYQELLGASVLLDGRPSTQRPWFDLRIGDTFVSVGRSANTGIDHFAVGLDPWPGADRALEMVKERFPKSEPRANANPLSKAAEVRSVMLKDPDGISVQLGSPKYQL
jgi:catechol 2,3-dioxygenase-like lactoylglutathione lyase family enzyme